jgi:exodeoxyribonuclease V alpha subunit
LASAYAITIHKSQGSEFPAVVILLAMQQQMLLRRHVIYTSVIQCKNLVVLIRQCKAFERTVRNKRTGNRISRLLALG